MRCGVFLTVFLLTCLSCGSGTPDAPESPPPQRWKPLNLVLITIDTLRADRLGSYGREKIETPVLDGLAQRGVLFEQAVAQSPLTPPSHASMFTGTYPTVHQVRDTGGFILKDSHQTLAEILLQQGWETAAFVGSAVLSRVFGLDQGFETYDDRMSGPEPDPAPAGGQAQRPASEVVDRAAQWLRERSGQKPFFLWVHLYDPHAPYDPPPPFREKYSDPYDGEVAYTDAQVGRLLEALKEVSPEQNTLITMLSDHGESLGEHGEHSHGVFLYDSTLRIPWIMAGPGIPAGARVEQQARTIDLLPTLLTLLGGTIPESCQGVSLVPSFQGQRVATTFSYAESLYPKINLGWAELRAVRSNRWKYVRAPRPELYDLTQDPAEAENVIGRYPAEARHLENMLLEMTGMTPQGAESVQTAPVDPETEQRLRSLGYLSAGSSRRLELTGQGIDPKDRLRILSLIEESTTTLKQTPRAVRIGMLRQAIEEDPGNPALYSLLGEAFEKTGQESKAQEVYESSLQREGTATARIYSRLARIYGRQGKLAQAVVAFEKALEMDPSDPDTQNRLAVTYLFQNRLAEAKSLLEATLLLDEHNAQAHNSLGWVALKEGNAASALQSFERSLQLDPEFLEPYINLGVLYRGLGDFAKARTSLETFLTKASPEFHADAIRRVKEELEAMPH